MDNSIISIKKFARKVLKYIQRLMIRPVWKSLLKKNSKEWSSVLKSAADGQRILIATSTGCYDHAVMLESALSVALTLRGANIHILLCDGILPCCLMTKINNIHPDILMNQHNTPRCDRCYENGKKYFGSLCLTVHYYGEMLSKSDFQKAKRLSQEIPLENIDTFKYEGLAVGEHALAGALRYFARGDLDGEPYSEEILRRYLKASLLTAFATQELIKRHKYDTAVFHHGIYVPQGIVGEVCRKNGVRVANWNPSYRKQTFIFSHNDSYHHTMITEPVMEWEKITWTEKIEKITLDYLKSRWYGTEDWIWFHEKPVEDINEIGKELGMDFNKPCIGMLTSVMWDAQLHYKSNAFRNMLDWVFKTIDYFSGRPELQLIIRIHPAEIRGMVPSRQKIADEINVAYPNLPENIFIIPPESRISTYAIMEKCNSVIIYNTKTGIEISSMGIPVIVAGEAWIRNKGFSIDASSQEEYFNILDGLPLAQGLDSVKLERARKYAFHFFFRRMIEIPFVISPKKYKFPLNFFISPKKHTFALQLKDLMELGEGVYPGLDAICNGILYGQSFAFNPILPEVKNEIHKQSRKGHA